MYWHESSVVWIHDHRARVVEAEMGAINDPDNKNMGSDCSDTGNQQKRQHQQVYLEGNIYR